MNVIFRLVSECLGFLWKCKISKFLNIQILLLLKIVYFKKKQMVWQTVKTLIIPLLSDQSLQCLYNPACSKFQEQEVHGWIPGCNVTNVYVSVIC